MRRVGPALIPAWIVVALLIPRPAAAQRSIAEALAFLLEARPVPTDDVVPALPAQADPAAAFSQLLRRDLSVRPLTSPAGGLTFEWDTALGTMARPTESFGPFFTARARATGLRRASLTVGLRQSEFDQIEGLPLRDGTLDAAVSRTAGDEAPFDVQAVSMRIRARSMTFTGEVGVTERLDFIVAVPFHEVILTGERIDTYRGTPFTQATAFASATGLGDVVMRAKFETVRVGPYTLALGGEVRLPTGNATNSLGTGERRLMPQAIASLVTRRVTVHAEGGYAIGETNDALHYGGAVAMAPLGRLSIVGEILGRTDFSAPALTSVTLPHPRLTGVTTRLLGGTTGTTHQLTAVGGIKWNVAGALLLNAYILRPITHGGFTSAWTPAVTLDYFFQQ